MLLDFINSYNSRLINCIQSANWLQLSQLVDKILLAREEGRHIFLCGNGGSAVNAMHIANDLLYLKKGIRVTALPANQAVLTCLANDIGYENIFSFQLNKLAKSGDMLIVLSGSGNSLNILKAVDIAKIMGVLTCAILGFDGGKCLNLVDIPVHFPVNDMQISEDLQLVVGHILMQWLNRNTVDGQNNG
jgi:D-sedoheptulose 7-phosphate isomerase